MSARFRSPVAMAAVSGMLALGVAGCASQGVIGASGTPGPSGGTSGPTGGTPSASGSSSASDPATPTSGPTTPGTTGSTHKATTTASPADPSALASSLQRLNELWTDPGCKIGLRGFGAYLTASQKSTAAGNAAIPAAIRDLRAGASASKRPDATKAMTDMAKDLQDIADQTKAGKTPDRGKLRNDWQIMGNACTG